MIRFLLTTLCLLAQAQTASGPRLYPVDDTDRDPRFRAFVKKLRSAVEAHNAGALRKLVDNEVVVGPAKGDTGWEQFRAKWHPEDAESEVWPALSDLLSLGFIREHPRLYVSPYLVFRFPRELNRARHVVVIRDGVPLRTEPDVRAPAVASLNFEIVELLGPPVGGEGLGRWIPVRRIQGEKGFVNAKDVMSPTMPHAQFGENHGRWMLVALED